MVGKIDGLHAFRATVSSEGVTLATAMGVDSDLEMAEDRAVKRALTMAGITENYRMEANFAPLPALSPAPAPSLRPYPESKYGDLAHDTPEPKPEPKLELPPEPPLDLSDYIAKIDVEMARVGWDREQGRKYITNTFHKASRQKLSQAELQQFLDHLRKLPSIQFTPNYSQEF